MPRQQQSNQNQDQEQDQSQEDLSEAAQKMRSDDPEERSEGASELGRAGGRQSHKND